MLRTSKSNSADSVTALQGRKGHPFISEYFPTHDFTRVKTVMVSSNTITVDIKTILGKVMVLSFGFLTVPDPPNRHREAYPSE